MATTVRLMTLAIVAAGMLTGCGAGSSGTSRQLGSVTYQDAFAEAREVMAQYFEIAEADVDTGTIKSRPKSAQGGPERLLGGGSPARQVATLRLRHDGTNVVAYMSVAVQRQDSAVYRHMMASGESDDSVPTLTPDEQEAATTSEQNEAWRTSRYAHDIEYKILNDLYTRLHPAEE